MRPILVMFLLAVVARADVRNDVVFAQVGGVDLTLDAFVPEDARAVVSNLKIAASRIGRRLKP